MNNLLKLSAFLALVSMCAAQTPVYLDVYFESKCPDSMAFISTQLWPTYQQLSDILFVNFVPYGFANFTANGSSWDFSCSHGPEECDGNRIFACAIKYYPKDSDNVPFISCSMSQPDPPMATPNCATQWGLDWPTIAACCGGFEGPNLLHDNGVITNSLSPPMGTMPWIVFNNVWTQANQDRSIVDFLGLVCDTYTGTRPAACPAA